MTRSGIRILRLYGSDQQYGHEYHRRTTRTALRRCAFTARERSGNLIQNSTFYNDTYMREAYVFTGTVWSVVVAHGGVGEQHDRLAA